MTESSEKITHTTIFDDDLIPDGRNLNTCLNCNKTKCTGFCAQLATGRGRPKTECKFAKGGKVK